MERLIICGGGHVSLALAHMASILDFDITVIDDREEFANKERFPMAGQVLSRAGSAAGAAAASVLAGVPFNIVQGLAGIIVGAVLLPVLSHASHEMDVRIKT